MKDLTQCRAELDAIDSQLVALFEERMRVARDIALYKHKNRSAKADLFLFVEHFSLFATNF